MTKRKQHAVILSYSYSGKSCPAFVPSCMVSPIIFKHKNFRAHTLSTPAAFRSDVCNHFMCFHSHAFFLHWDVCGLIWLAGKRRLAEHRSAPPSYILTTLSAGRISIQCHMSSGWQMRGGKRLPLFQSSVIFRCWSTRDFSLLLPSPSTILFVRSEVSLKHRTLINT